jgi:hypothetical protein
MTELASKFDQTLERVLGDRTGSVDIRIRKGVNRPIQLGIGEATAPKWAARKVHAIRT